MSYTVSKLVHFFETQCICSHYLHMVEPEYTQFKGKCVFYHLGEFSKNVIMKVLSDVCSASISHWLCEKEHRPEVLQYFGKLSYFLKRDIHPEGFKKRQIQLDKINKCECTMDLERVCATCLLYTSPSPRDGLLSRMPSSA